MKESTIMRPRNSTRALLLPVVLLSSMLIGCTTIRPGTPEADPPTAEAVFSHARFGQMLEKFVNDRGRVDYGGLKNDAGDLDAYYARIAAYSPDSHPALFPTEQHKLAYWINAYNAGAIQIVLANYPIGSVREVKPPAVFFFLPELSGFFVFHRLEFGGRTTSLYYLENQVIRARFDDPRIHFALNCASLGCPRLPRQPFSGDRLDRQLEREARRFLAEKRNFFIDHNEETIRLSSIFKWYEEDFTRHYRSRFPEREASLLNAIDPYLSAEKSAALQKVAGRYSVHFEPYDWRLNDQQAP